jgi:hypothetical protein
MPRQRARPLAGPMTSSGGASCTGRLPDYRPPLPVITDRPPEAGDDNVRDYIAGNLWLSPSRST